MAKESIAIQTDEVAFQSTRPFDLSLYQNQDLLSLLRRYNDALNTLAKPLNTHPETEEEIKATQQLLSEKSSALNIKQEITHQHYQLLRARQEMEIKLVEAKAIQAFLSAKKEKLTSKMQEPLRQYVLKHLDYLVNSDRAASIFYGIILPAGLGALGIALGVFAFYWVAAVMLAIAFTYILGVIAFVVGDIIVERKRDEKTLRKTEASLLALRGSMSPINDEIRESSLELPPLELSGLSLTGTERNVTVEQEQVRSRDAFFQANPTAISQLAATPVPPRASNT